MWRVGLTGTPFSPALLLDYCYGWQGGWSFIQLKRGTVTRVLGLGPPRVLTGVTALDWLGDQVTLSTLGRDDRDSRFAFPFTGWDIHSFGNEEKDALRFGMGAGGTRPDGSRVASAQGEVADTRVVIGTPRPVPGHWICQSAPGRRLVGPPEKRALLRPGRKGTFGPPGAGGKRWWDSGQEKVMRERRRQQ